MSKKLILNPSELLEDQKKNPSQIQKELSKSLMIILKWRFCGRPTKVTLNEISQWIGNTIKWNKIASSDRDILEALMMENGRSMKYDGPWYSESYDSFFIIDAAKKANK